MTTPLRSLIRTLLPTKPQSWFFLNHFDGVRENNYTPLRLMLALAVLFGHSFHISKTPGYHDPLSAALHSTWIGAVAVNGFFIMSGFLVAGSLTKHSLKEYVLSRALRLYPGLAVNILFTIVVGGLVVTSWTPQAFFASHDTLLYFFNITLIPGIPRSLPGVFDTNTVSAINGSLWTLPVEALCYTALGIFGAMGLITRRPLANLLFAAAYVWGFAFPDTIPHPPFGHFDDWLRIILYFSLGVFIFINRRVIVLTPLIAIAAVALYFIWQGRPYFNLVTAPALAYALFYCAYSLPALPFDRLVGDLSYGVYIYAWPVQQTAELLYPDNNPFQNAGISAVATLLLAKLSWSLIEKPSLDFKRRLLSRRSGKPGPARQETPESMIV